MDLKLSYIVIAWLSFALLIAVIMFIFHPLYYGNYTFANAFRWEFAFVLTWIPATRFVLYIANKFPISKKTAVKNGLILFVIGIVQTSVQCFLHGTIMYVIDPNVKIYSEAVIINSFYYNMDKMIVVYCILVVLQHAADYYSKFREKELKASSLEAELARAQMQALKMQLHPHFLFNTLNAIVTLVHKDPDTAEQMIVRLSDFLRLTLKSSGRQMITLIEEIEFARAYLEIERTRFNDRLAVNISLDENLQDAEVPNLLLQPLIENAIKHGITPNTSGGIISIAANKTDGFLKITVIDNGRQNSGNPETKLKEGVGLSNTRARLEKLFGSKASLNLKYNEPCGVEVTVSLPFRIAEQS